MFGQLKQWVRLVFPLTEVSDTQFEVASVAPPQVSVRGSDSTETEGNNNILTSADLRWLTRFHTVFELNPASVTQMLSPSVRQIALFAIREFLREVTSASKAGLPLSVHLEDRVGQLRGVHVAAIARLLASASELELLVRTLAWALDAPRPQCNSVRVIFAPHDHQQYVEVASDLEFLKPKSTLYWWVSVHTVPKWLTERVRETGAVLLIDSRVPTPMHRVRHLTDINPAIVGRTDDRGEVVEFTLPGAAGYFQALHHPHGSRSWVAIRPPAGFDRLCHDIMLHDEKCLAAKGEVATIQADGSSENIVRSLISILNPPA